MISPRHITCITSDGFNVSYVETSHHSYLVLPNQKIIDLRSVTAAIRLRNDMRKYSLPEIILYYSREAKDLMSFLSKLGIQSRIGDL